MERKQSIVRLYQRVAKGELTPEQAATIMQEQDAEQERLESKAAREVLFIAAIGIITVGAILYGVFHF